MDGLDRPAHSGEGLAFRWLGTAGLALRASGAGLLVDPFFTRPPARALLTLERVAPDPALIARHTPPASYVLVTHAHYDHLLDVPEILRLTGARAFGPENVCALLKLHGLPGSQINLVRPGDQLELGPFTVEVFPGYHIRTPIDRLINSPLPESIASGRARPPLRLTDYRMDTCLAFRIRAGGHTALAGSCPAEAELFFAIPYQPADQLRALLKAVNPREVVPIHWDNFTRPISHPLRPMPVVRRGWPPVGRVDLNAFTRLARTVLPDARVTIPELFREYQML